MSESPSNSSDYSDKTAFTEIQSTQLVGNRFNFDTFLVKLSTLPMTIFSTITLYFYGLYQNLIHYLFAPEYVPPSPGFKPRGRIAIIGAGITGIASAATLKDNGFEVVIFESENSVGGIWSRVNSTSSLQLNSILYRFHPSVTWSCGFPKKAEIVSEIEKVWKKYDLESSTRLNTRVHKVARHDALSTDPKKGGHGRWAIDDGREGVFDAVIVAVGTCGPPNSIESTHIQGIESFGGLVVHSSALDGVDMKGKKVVIVGSGASAVESAELAVEKGAEEIKVLARDDKWIIPRNTLFDVMLALQPFGREMPLSFIPEYLIKRFHYRDLKSLAPSKKGLFEGTPIVNNRFLDHIRAGLIQYKKGDIIKITSQGVRFSERSSSSHNSSSEEAGFEAIEMADILVMATGYQKPYIGMLPSDLFPTEGEREYTKPNLYLQNFSTEDWTILLSNASYKDAIGTVGNWHIGLYARILSVFLLDKSTRPLPKAMKTWVDVINWIKVSTIGGEAKGSGLAFFTYCELIIWIIGFHFFKPLARLPWLPYVLFGWGNRPQNDHQDVVKGELKAGRY